MLAIDSPAWWKDEMCKDGLKDKRMVGHAGRRASGRVHGRRAGGGSDLRAGLGTNDRMGMRVDRRWTVGRKEKSEVPPMGNLY